MKEAFIVVMMLLPLVLAPLAHGGGIPVYDAVNYVQNVQASLDQIAKMAQQITEMQRQYFQLQQTYSAMTGGRGLGTIMNDVRNRNYLPDNWRGVYDGIRSGGYAGLTGAARSVMNSNRVYDMCASMQGEQKMACERQVAIAAQDRAYSGDAYERAKDRLNQIEGLMGQANATQDQKAILELNARMQAENAMIQNEQIKLNMYKMVSENERRLAEQQQREIEVKKYSKRGGVKIEPIDMKNQ